MPLNHHAVGAASEEAERTWTADDAMLYALAVGAGVEAPHLTTENTEGITLEVLPTMAIILGKGGRGRREALGDYDAKMLVHAEQEIGLAEPIAVSGAVRSVERIVGIYDKGSGALVVTDTESRYVDDGRMAWTARSSVFIRGEGGFGGDRGPSVPWLVPERPADATAIQTTATNQALLYRLTGDRNPLHSDHGYATAAGFERPILHGMCTYGHVGRALLAECCDDDVRRFRSMRARFSAPVYPGDTLTTDCWRMAHGLVAFRTVRQDGTPVLDRGELIFTD